MDMCNEHSKSPRNLTVEPSKFTYRSSEISSTTSSNFEFAEWNFRCYCQWPWPSCPPCSDCRDWDPLHQWTLRSDVDCASFLQMVQNLLQNIDSRKATGADGIPGLLLKKCAPNLAPSLTAISIASFAARELPQAFKQAQTLPLYTSPEIGKQPATIDQFLSFPSWASF